MRLHTVPCIFAAALIAACTAALAPSAAALPLVSRGSGFFEAVTAIQDEPVLSVSGALSAGEGEILISRGSSAGVDITRYSFPEQLGQAEFTSVTLTGDGSFKLPLGCDLPYAFTVDSEGHEEEIVLAGGFPDCPFFIRADGREWLISRPFSYEAAENGCLHLLGRAELSLVRTGGVWSLVAAHGDGEFTSMWYASATTFSEDGSYRWYAECSLGMFGGAHMFCGGGYYYRTSTSHIPHDSDIFYRIPAPHIAVKLASGSSGAAAAVGTAMLDICCADICTEGDTGYVPTGPGVDWLGADYGIEPGFYDTRFNTDFASALLSLGERYGITDFTESALMLARYIAERVSALPEEAAFLPDYWNTDGSGTRTSHTSLNHQAAEALLLLRTGFEEEGLKLARAINESAGEWISPGGDLWYARRAEGGYFGTDYPYLTYNDLLALNAELLPRGAECGGIDHLIAAKLAWMLANGVTGYREQENALPQFT